MMIRLPSPINLILDGIESGGFMLIEYNSLSEIEFLSIDMLKIEHVILIEIGDKLHIKIPALLKFMNRSLKVIIISISSFPLEIPNFEVINIPLDDLTKILSKIYSFLKDGYKDWIIVLSSIDQVMLYLDVREFLRELARLTKALPNLTIIGFLNYDVVDKMTLSLLESISTTVVRAEGRIDFGMKRIRRFIYVVKSVNPHKKEMVEYEIRDTKAR